MKGSRLLVIGLLSLPWLVLLFGFGWFLLLRFPLDGQRAFSFTFDGQSPWFEPFLPAQRVTAAGPQSDGWVGQRILMDPVYAGVRLPGIFDSVDVTLELRMLRQPLLELGIVRNLDPFEADMQPIWSQALQQGWREVSQGSMHGYVRDGAPDRDLTQSDFDHVLTWYATTTAPAFMDATSTPHSWPMSLRGAHDIYFIPVNGSADFSIDFQDMNRNKDGSLASFRLLRDDALLQTDTLSLGGSMDTHANQVTTKTFSFHGLSPGAYRLAISDTDDVFIRRIETSAQHWVLGPGLFAGDTVGWSTSTQPLAIWTNSRHLAVQTLHQQGLQTVTFGQSTLELTKTHQNYALDRTAGEASGAVEVTAPKGNVSLVGDGYFAFDPSALFLPKPRRLTDASDPIAEGIAAILTPYHRPELTVDGWVRAKASFTLPQAVDSYKVALSAPGLLARTGAVDIRAIGLVYHRPVMNWQTAWSYLRQELSSAWHRL